MPDHLHQDTLALHAGYEPKNGEPRVVPIIQSTTFRYESTEQMGRLFDLAEAGYFYSRLQNPTCDSAAAKITALEGGVAGMLTSSGQAANFFAIFNICEAGDHFVSAASLYGGTFNLFNTTLRKMGIDVTFVDQDAPLEELRKAIQPNTKCVFGESVANPALSVLDFEKFATLAHEAGVPLIVDNTFPTPINCRPFEFGVDIVTHSTTKYLDGHGVSVGGAIVDSGNFDWSAQGDKFPGLTAPDESYHGMVYADTFGKGAYITKAVTHLMRDLGSTQSPQNAFYITNGMVTLALRMARHVENAQAIAEFLSRRDDIDFVRYPGLKGDPYYDLAQKYMPNGTCGVISFALKGSREDATKFLDSLKLATIATHVADARTCILHPASHTHRQLNDEALAASGVTPTMIRLSVGIENIDDLLADITQALDGLR